MADKLTDLFNEAQKANADVSDFVSFQAGFTKSAVNMRSRAIKAAQDNKDRNTIINAIGSLPDIP